VSRVARRTLSMSNQLSTPLVDPLAGEDEETGKPGGLTGRVDTWGESMTSPVEGDTTESMFDRSQTQPMGAAFTGGKATMKATIFNLINTVIGAGLLALPQAIQQNGIILGVGMIILVSFMADVTVNMLLFATDHAKETNFGRISQVLAGNVAKFFVDLIIFLLNFGLCASYCIIIGDNLVFYAQSAGAAPGSPWQDIKVLLAGVFVLILYPLSTLKKMSALRHVSLLCLIFITLFVVLIVVASTGVLGMPVAMNASSINWMDLEQVTPLGLLQNVPVIFFAFVCHMNVPLLYGELRRASKQERPSKWKQKKGKMMCAVHCAIGYCAFLYIAVSVSGYILFGDALSLPENAGNILNAIHTSHLSIAPYVKLVYAILLALSFPCMSYSGRAALHRLMSTCCACVDTMGDKIRFLEAFIIVGSTTGLAMTGLSVAVAFGLTGSITCTAIMYIFPGSFHLIASKKQKRGCAPNVLSWGAIILGFAVMGASTAAILISAGTSN